MKLDIVAGHHARVAHGTVSRADAPTVYDLEVSRSRVLARIRWVAVAAVVAAVLVFNEMMRRGGSGVG